MNLSRCVGIHLGLQLHILLQSPCILDTKAVLEDLADVLQRHALDFRVTEVDCDPAEEADGCVEAEGARRGCILHLSEECGGHDDVGTPAGAGD